MSGRSRFPIPARVHRVEEVIQRSRFVTTVAHAPDSEAAHAFVQTIRDELPDATHHCWAFVAGPPGSTAHIGLSDDGEPSGTAGRPMLTTILHADIGETVVVGTRYYGGVKLGTGGLGRAYSGGVRLALASLPREEKVARRVVAVTVGYTDVDALQRFVAESDVVLVDEVFGAEVRLRLGVPVDDVESLTRRIADMTRGEARVDTGLEDS